MGIETPGKRYGKRLQHSKVFGHGLHGHKSTFADLNVTPLVDMFVILVCFLIANFAASGELMSMSKDIQLPEAVHGDELVLAPVVQISQQDVVVSGAAIGRVDDLSREDYSNIPALEEKLRELKKEFEDLHNQAGDSGAFKGDVNIQADKGVPFKIIKKVMFSCSSAGYGNISFATLTAGEAKKPETAMR